MASAPPAATGSAPSVVSRYLKAIIAAVCTGAAVASASLAANGGRFDRTVWLSGILGALGSGSLVGLAPNAPSRNVITDLQAELKAMQDHLETVPDIATAISDGTVDALTKTGLLSQLTGGQFDLGALSDAQRQQLEEFVLTLVKRSKPSPFPDLLATTSTPVATPAVTSTVNPGGWQAPQFG